MDAHRASVLVNRFLNGCAGIGLTRDTESCAGIPGMASPRVCHVTLGRDTDRLVVQMLPGQLVDEYERSAGRLAEALGAHHLRIRRRAFGVITLELLYSDPLGIQLEIHPEPAPDLLLGSTDAGPMRARLDQMAHLITQGATRSGKSRFTYGLLVQLIERDDVLICGSDVTGLLLRPFKGTKHDHLQALGSKDPEAHLAVLEELCRIMDERLASMPDDTDVFPCSTTDPYIWVVLEELPGLLRVAQATDDLHKGQRGYVPLVARIKATYGRLLAESAKVGFRVHVITQRADATIVGGFERGQAPLRISFAVDSTEAVAMLHPAADLDTAKAHLNALPSYALVSAPGLPCTRLRAPLMGSYQDFYARIAAHQVVPAE
ncbi:FtsK/SpoIIIE domain-containing protein [Amycolatopsis sacchari]|uniref:FtsK/SpoIIIE domain-containing protein n=1 Tax=Amycolatopsis sacchari TaxID=115433 RepID=UPI003D729B4D